MTSAYGMPSSFASSSSKNRCKLVQHVPANVSGHLITERTGVACSGSPPEAKIDLGKTPPFMREKL